MKNLTDSVSGVCTVIFEKIEPFNAEEAQSINRSLSAFISAFNSFTSEIQDTDLNKIVLKFACSSSAIQLIHNYLYNTNQYHKYYKILISFKE